MKISDLGSVKKKKINEGAMATVGNYLARKGFAGDAAMTQANRQHYADQVGVTWINDFKRAFESAVTSGIVTQGGRVQSSSGPGPQPSPVNPQQPQDSETPQSTEPQQSTTPAQTVNQPQGQAVDLDQLKQQRLAKQQQGQTDQQQAIQQMDQTKQANAQAAAADAELVAAVKAAKAKPGFQQTALDKATLKKGAEKGIYENFERMFAMLMEYAEQGPAPTTGDESSATAYVKKYLAKQTRGFDLSQYQSQIDSLADAFGAEFDKTGQFPEKIAKQLYSIVASTSELQSRDSWGNVIGAGGGAAGGAGGGAGGPMAQPGTSEATDQYAATMAKLAQKLATGNAPPQAVLQFLTVVAGWAYQTDQQTFTKYFGNGLLAQNVMKQTGQKSAESAQTQATAQQSQPPA